MKTLDHPLVRLLGAVLAVGLGLRALFFLVAPELWSHVTIIDMVEIAPWARSQMGNRDGLEPYALMALVGLAWVATAALATGLERLRPAPRAAVTALLLTAAIPLLVVAPPRPPMPELARAPETVVLVVIASLAVTALLARATARGRRATTGLLVALLAVCFLPTTLGSLQDLAAVLAPALRAQHGFPPSQIYLQYDLFPSLLGRAWTALGGAPLAFTVVGGASFFGLFVAMHALGRRLYARRTLVAPMLVTTVIVRFYAVHLDPSATPQATPMRLDLWIVLLAVAYRRGLRDWMVGLTLAALCFFSRSMGTLYLGSYALAVVADLLAQRHAMPRAARAPLTRDVAALGRALLPAVGFVGLAFVAARLVFGSFGSDAIALYRTLGIGMMRIGAESFFWWLLPLLAALGWQAFVRRATLPPRHGAAAIFAVTLLAGSLIYFFGRSHEHNLINVCAPILFCAFWGLDLSWPTRDAPPAVRGLFRVAPWAIVGVTALFYSGLVADKVAAQVDFVTKQKPLPAAMASDRPLEIDCQEIASATGGDAHVVFVSRDDYWFYERCGYAPRGYIQPLPLTALKRPVVDELKRFLDDGYKLLVPKAVGDWTGMFAELIPDLGPLTGTESTHYRVYRRR